MNRMTALAAVGACLAMLATPAWAATAIAQTQETQSGSTPATALEALKEGNRRFVGGGMLERDFPGQVKATSRGQYPLAIVLGCIDSRVPPELVFDQGIGDVFSTRIAGNFVNTDILGSIEFATAVAGARLVVVLGHTECGAVKGACDQVELGNLTQTLSNLAPAVYATADVEGARSSANPAFVDAVAHENVAMTVQNILERSSVVRGLHEEGKVQVVGAMYEVSTGVVTFLD